MDLANDRKKGFTTDEKRAEYELGFRLHHKIHRINRNTDNEREGLIMESPELYSGNQFDWTRFSLPGGYATC